MRLSRALPLATLSLINDVLDISKIEAGKLELEIRNCDLEELVHETIGMFTSRAKQKGLALSCRLDPATCVVVLCDENRLRQILVNLLGNALKFTNAGSVLLESNCVHSDDTQVVVRLEVFDTGIGIPDDKLGKLFSPFSQVDSSTSRQFGGTGLGLSITKQLTELMGGTIGVKSRLGVGSTFWIETPFRLFNAMSSASDGVHPIEITDQESPPQEQATKFTGHILVAEDNSINQLYVRELLKYCGCTCDIANNGDIALNAVQNNRYDLALMDCQMPEMDGFTACREIRRREATGQLSGRLPIIALTANALKGDRERCYDAGMDDYLSKPLQAAQLQMMLEKYLCKT
jgi:CheY-like chemotaxis protein